MAGSSYDIGTAYIKVMPNATGIQGNIQNALTPEATAAGVSAGKATASSMSSTLQSVGGKMIKAGAIATAISVPLIKGIQSALSAYEEQINAEVRLTEIYKTRMGASEEAAKATMNLASALQQTGVVGDEVQLSGAQQLATFAKYPDTINTLLPAMNNLLVQQNGLNATSGDAVNIANLMGKAMQGQTGALRRVGITFDEAQEQVLKYGTEEERAAVLSEVITENVGNMNEVMADTPLGKIQQMKNSMGDLKEEVGAQLAPVIAKLAQWISKRIIPALEKFMKVMGKHPIIAKATVALTALLAVGGPLLIVVGSLISSVGKLMPVISALSAPVLAVVAGIALLVAGLVVAYNKSETFRKAVQTLAQGIKTFLIGAINLLKPLLQALWSLFQKVATILGTVLAPVISKVGTILTGLGAVFTAVGAKITPLVTKIRNFATTAKTVFNGVKEKIATPFTTAVSAIRGAWSTVSGWFSGIVAKIKGAFSGVASKITAPFTTAHNAISGFINKVKGWFPLSVGKIFSNIKFPKIEASKGKAPWGILGKGKAPKFSIKWNALGGIVNGATLIGAGEAGAEAIVPLKPFWERLDAQSRNTDYLLNQILGVVSELAIEVENGRSITISGREFGRLVRG